MRFLTAGESHGPKLLGIIEGLPAGLPVKKDQIDEALQKRQGGPGRGGRMKIEKDKVDIVTGVRAGVTTGAPVGLEIKNKDWANWEQIMTWDKNADVESRKVLEPRPGHADLTGALKYRTEVRNILERASARETAMRVAVGSVARQLLTGTGIQIQGRVLSVAGAEAQKDDSVEYWRRVKTSEWSTGDVEIEPVWGQKLEEARVQGESLGGVLEIQVCNVPAGLGSHVQWDRKLDGRLAHAVLSVQAMKGISFGLGFEAADRLGSAVHDPIDYSSGKGFYRMSNHAGGIEGGMSNGETILMKVAMKPIPTLYQPLPTICIDTKEKVLASIERSDICAVPAALVVLEHVAAWVIAEALLEKFPADTYEELLASVSKYRKYLEEI